MPAPRTARTFSAYRGVPAMTPPALDPVVHSSLSKPLAISAALLVIGLLWGLYDETFTIRPWKVYQSRFVKLYSRFLAHASLGQAEIERQIKASPEYQRLDAAMQQAERAALPAADAIDRKINQIGRASCRERV